MQHNIQYKIQTCTNTRKKLGKNFKQLFSLKPVVFMASSPVEVSLNSKCSCVVGLKLYNSYAEFTILDIKYHFTCGELNFLQNTPNCKDIMSPIVDAIKKNTDASN